MQTGKGEWAITHTWKATGGRYLNLGNGMNYQIHDDNVFHGETR